jgi:hypothetical protein
MEAVRGALRGMKITWNNAVLILSVFVVPGFHAVRAQQNPAGQANDFTSIEYFEPPHQQLIKSRLSGAEAQPLAGGLLVIKQLKLETFDTNGAPGLIVKAPNCVYDTLQGVASSPGHLRLETADASSHVEGDGFLWRQTNQFLTISNNVRTVIEAAPEKKTGS